MVSRIFTLKVIASEDDAREESMIRTITLGAHISVQGAFVRNLPDGKIVVRDGERIFTGRPVSAAVSAAA